MNGEWFLAIPKSIVGLLDSDPVDAFKSTTELNLRRLFVNRRQQYTYVLHTHISIYM